MINTNKRWLLTASPWMKDGPRLSLFGIRGIFLIALLVFGSLTGKAQVGLPAITGTTTICPTTTSTLHNAVTGGVWSSGNPLIATVNPATGLVTGVAGGYVYITYTVGPSNISTLVTVTYPISGASTVCAGNNLVLTDATPSGLWVSSNPAVATVTPLGVVKALTAGNTTITYGRAGACTVSNTVTVNPNTVADIAGTGALAVCVGGSITATDATPLGTWTSSSPALATINSSTGVINGIAAGPAVITYTVGGCYKSRPLTVAAPGILAPIVGATNVCTGNTTVLTDATALGTWSSSNTAIATINTDGKVTGIAPGTVTISYTKTGCSVTKLITVDPNGVAAITGGLNVCVAQTSTLADATPGGTWTSSNIAVATVAGGVVTGVATGSAVITYTVGGCFKTATVVVNPATVVGAISGASAVCNGATTTLTDAILGGTWSTSNSAVATVNAYGLVTGVSAGSVSINYTRLGCSVAQPMTVNPLPAAITGNGRECAANKFNTTTLADATAGGAWSSSNTAIATVAAGVVTGVTTGVVNISYTLPTGCYVTAKDTVYGPPAITGGSTACIAPLTYLYMYNATMGGVWASTTPAIASVGAGTGVVTGLYPGLDSIKYTVTYSAGLACYVAQPISVAWMPGIISGNFSTCTGATTTLTDTMVLGTWSSANTAVATVVPTTGVVSGVSAGNTMISYTKNGCSRTVNVNVGAALPAITGPDSVCGGLGVATLTNTATGGEWSASNTNVLITVTSPTTAVITGASNGAVTVSYTKGGCTVSKPEFVKTNGVTSVTGLPWVCTGLNVTLTSGGGVGTWSSANPLIASFSGSTSNTTAAVLGVSAGSTVITYTKTSDGCFKTVVFSVHTQPAPITGAYTMCNGTTTTLLESSIGGSWTSGNTDVATVNSGGVVTGVSSGLVTITYAMPGGCESYQPITVTAVPEAIGGASAVCVGATTTLTNGLAGGTWTSSVPAKGTIDPVTGVFGGVTAGNTVITYALGACSVTKTVTVGAVTPVINTAPVSVCAMGMPSTNVTVNTGGGAWTTSNALVATVAANGTAAGRVTGVSAGTVTITYTLVGCYTTQTETVVANYMPAITGNTDICVGNTATINETLGGGVWSSSNILKATIGTGNGLVTGVAPGSVIMTYAIDSGGCRQFFSMNVGGVTPGAIGANVPVCAGNTFTLTEGTIGGTWTSSDPTIASINSFGVVYGVAAGTANVTYTLVGCYPTPVVVTVNPVPLPITGTASVCVGSTTALSDLTGGGTWSSATPAKGTVDASGVVTGLAAGSTVISYTVGGCPATLSVAVGATPAGITGATSVCAGSAVTLANTVTGGTWNSSNQTIAANSGATFTGVLGGTVTVSYTTPGCVPATASLTVNYIAPITGGSYVVCKTDSMVLADATGGGTWTSSDATIAAIGTTYTGQIMGINAGSVNITYTVGSCNVTQPVVVNACGHREINEPVVNATGNQVYSLFPNPSNGNITISQSVIVDGAMEVSVMNYVGARIYTGTIDFAGGKGQLNISSVPGMYLVMLQDKKGVTQTFKVLIEN